MKACCAVQPSGSGLRSMYCHTMRHDILAASCLVIGLVACSSKPDPEAAQAAAFRACRHGAELSCPRPILNIRNLQASQRYYRNALGFKLDWEHGEPPDFASVSRGDTVIFLCQGCQGGGAAWMALFIEDVDALYKELVGRGALIKSPPANMPWRLREMQVADPDGNIMRIGGPVPD